MEAIARRTSYIIIAIVFAILAVVSSIGLVNAEGQLNEEKPKKITICHRRNNVEQPYGPKPIRVSINSVDGGDDKGDHYSEHKGPLASSKEVAEQLKSEKTKWGDIIPPIEGKHMGLNWTLLGQFIYNNDCQYPEAYFQFAKDWKGDAIDLEKVDVTFYVGDLPWKLGDDPVPVKPGQTLQPLSEKVTGLPSNCTYKSDLPESYTVPGGELERVMSYDNDNGDREYELFTLTATNTVECEEEGEVASDTDQVTVKPQGAVSAGGGTDVSMTVAGLVASTGLVASGVVIRKLYA